MLFFCHRSWACYGNELNLCLHLLQKKPLDINAGGFYRQPFFYLNDSLNFLGDGGFCMDITCIVTEICIVRFKWDGNYFTERSKFTAAAFHTTTASSLSCSASRISDHTETGSQFTLTIVPSLYYLLHDITQHSLDSVKRWCSWCHSLNCGSFDSLCNE